MHGQAYLTCAEHAANLGRSMDTRVNREPMLRVMEMHRDAVEAIDPSALRRAARQRHARLGRMPRTGPATWLSQQPGYGPCPDRHHRLHDGLRHDRHRADIALVKYKQLAGGGMLKIVNRTVPMALRKLGYDEPEIRGILDFVDAT